MPSFFIASHLFPETAHRKLEHMLNQLNQAGLCANKCAKTKKGPTTNAVSP